MKNGWLIGIASLCTLASAFDCPAGDSQNIRALKPFEISATASASFEGRPPIITLEGDSAASEFCGVTGDDNWLMPAAVGASNPHKGTTPGAAWIKYDFVKPFELQHMRVWNCNEGWDRGFKSVIIETTADGKTWEKVGVYEFARATGRPDYTANTTIDFKGRKVSAIVLTAQGGNWGGNTRVYGLGKVRFYARKDPLEAAHHLETGSANRGLRLDSGGGYWAEGIVGGMGSRPLTIEFSTKIDSLAGTNVLLSYAPGEKHGWVLGTKQDGKLSFSGFGCSIASPQSIPMDEWVHVALTLSDNSICAYLNGEKVFEKSVLTKGNAQTGLLCVGAHPPARLGCKGVIDELQIRAGEHVETHAPVEGDNATLHLWQFNAYDGGFSDAGVRRDKLLLTPPAPKPRLPLERGLVIDRRLINRADLSVRSVSKQDIALIRSMGFEFIKILANPASIKSGDRLDLARMALCDEMIDWVNEAGMQCVFCIHPEADFKQKIFSSKAEFESYLRFMDALAEHLAPRSPDLVAFQFMTEPFKTSVHPDDWNHWDNLQYRIWRVVRKQIPEHTLILAGDQRGKTRGLMSIRPVNDANVMYSFTNYEPPAFTLQGWSALTGGGCYSGRVPYPSSPEDIEGLQSMFAAVPKSKRGAVVNQVTGYALERWNKEKLAGKIEEVVNWADFRYGGNMKLWCAEFGALDHVMGGGHGGGCIPEDRLTFTKDLCDIFRKHGIGWSYWSYNETFTVLDPETRIPFGPADKQTPDAKLLRCLMPAPEPTR